MNACSMRRGVDSAYPLELEADIEYLMVEGVHMIWQATGDDAWMIRQLPRLKILCVHDVGSLALGQSVRIGEAPALRHLGFRS